MVQFKYRARNRNAQVLESVIEANSSADAIRQLVQQNLVPIAVTEVEVPKPMTSFLGPPPPRMKHAELIVFTRQLSSILNAGLSLLDTLELLEKQMSKRAAPIVRRVVEDIKSGLSLSDALAKHPKAFSDVYVNMVRVGEMGGILSEVLSRMANLFEYTEENRNRIKAALRYPKIVVSIMVVAFATIIMMIVPKFTGIFKSFKAELPIPTQILIGVNHVLSGYWYILVPSLVGLYVGFRFWRKGRGGLLVDRWMLKVPVFGALTLKSEIARFCRFFAALYKSGISVAESLTMSSKIVENSYISKLIEDMKVSAVQGQSLVTPLRDSKAIPDLVVQMITVGENTGTLSEMFERLSTYYEAEVDYAIKNLTSYIEPFLIVGLGAVILLIALGVFLPMWNMMNLFKNKM
jgi:type II secretory pathway component PulF